MKTEDLENGLVFDDELLKEIMELPTPRQVREARMQLIEEWHDLVRGPLWEHLRVVKPFDSVLSHKSQDPDHNATVALDDLRLALDACMEVYIRVHLPQVYQSIKQHQP